MGTPQILTTDSGDELVVLSRREYDAILARAGDEAAEDRMTIRMSADAAGQSHLPMAVWDALEAPSVSRLAVLRRHRGMTQQQLADAAGVKRPNLSAMEAKTKGFTADTLDRLARALDVSMEVLKG